MGNVTESAPNSEHFVYQMDRTHLSSYEHGIETPAALLHARQDSISPIPPGDIHRPLVRSFLIG